MSVLLAKRNESKAQFVKTGYDIYIQSLNFASLLSAKYSRILLPGIVGNATELLTHVSQANAIRPVDEERYLLRHHDFLEAKRALDALDTYLSICYDIIRQNPQGAFRKKKEQLTPDAALAKLNKMAFALGTLIDTETKLLGGIIKSDTESFNKKKNKE